MDASTKTTGRVTPWNNSHCSTLPWTVDDALEIAEQTEV
jgi:hypothetical protein